MKVSMFHLMPYSAMPEEPPHGPDWKTAGIWVDLPNSVYDPQIGNELYNEYLDELEYAEQVGLDGICVNEHHANMYGTMPSPSIMLAALARRTSKANLIVLGHLDRPLQPAHPCRRGDVDDRRDLRRARGLRLPRGHLAGHELGLRHVALDLPRALLRGRGPDQEGDGDARAVPLQRQVHEAALRQHLAASRPGAASPDLGARRWLHRDLGLDDREGPRLRGAQLRRLQARPADPQRLLEPRPRARRRRDPVPRCLHAADPRLRLLRVRPRRSTRRASSSSTRSCSAPPAATSPRRPATAPRPRSAPASSAASRSRRSPPRRPAARRPPAGGPSWDQLVEEGNIVAGSPDEVAEKLRDISKSLRVGHVLPLLQIGNMRRETTMKNIKMFGEEVLPQIHTSGTTRTGKTAGRLGRSRSA